MAVGSISSAHSFVSQSFVSCTPLVLLVPSPLSLQLIPCLRNANYRLVTLSSCEANASVLAQLGCRVVHGSFHCVDDVIQITRSCTFVICSVVSLQTRHEANVQMALMRNILTACRVNRVARLIVHTSEAALFDSKAIVSANECVSFPSNPSSFCARVSQEVEALIRDAHVNNSPPCTILRTRLLWGMLQDPLLQTLVSQLSRHHSLLLVRNGHFLTSTCHIQNACEAVLCVLRTKRPQSLSYMITDGRPILFSHFIMHLLHACHFHDARIHAVPFCVAWLFALFNELLAFCLGKAPVFTTARVRLFSTEITLCDQNARLQLGYVGRTGMEDGMRLLSKQMKASSGRKRCSRCS